ncbi:hypothetical protein ACJX0J_015544, partial [Zea mays]
MEQLEIPTYEQFTSEINKECSWLILRNDIKCNVDGSQASTPRSKHICATRTTFRISQTPEFSKTEWFSFLQQEIMFNFSHM